MSVATVIREVPANPLQKALAVNQFTPEWSPYFTDRPRADFIDLVGASPLTAADGFFALPQGGMVQGERLFLKPIAEGPPPTVFSMRIWGWSVYGPTQGDGSRQMADCSFIAEFLLTTCNSPGPPALGAPGTGSLRPVQPTEWFCDTCQLVQGDLGQGGWINMTGQPGAPTDLPGYIILDLQGFQAFQFDFKYQDPVAMNCLWRKA